MYWLVQARRHQRVCRDCSPANLDGGVPKRVAGLVQAAAGWETGWCMTGERDALLLCMPGVDLAAGSLVVAASTLGA